MKKITIEWDECGDAQVGTGDSRPSAATEPQGFDEDDSGESDGGGFDSGTGDGTGTGEIAGDDEDAGPPPAALIRAVEGIGEASDSEFDNFGDADFDEVDPITDSSGSGESEDAGSGPSGPDATENEDEGDD